MSEGVLIFIINSSDSEDANKSDHPGYARTRDSRGGRHQAPDAQPVPLSAGEAQALVEQRVAQQVLPCLPDNLRLHELAVHHLASDAPPLVTRAGHMGAGTKKLEEIKISFYGVTNIFRKVPYETLLRKVRVL